MIADNYLFVCAIVCVSCDVCVRVHAGPGSGVLQAPSVPPGAEEQSTETLHVCACVCVRACVCVCVCVCV